MSASDRCAARPAGARRRGDLDPAVFGDELHLELEQLGIVADELLEPAADALDKRCALFQRLLEPRAVAVGPDNSLYIADLANRVRKVSPDGIITTIAGNGQSKPDGHDPHIPGDPGPAPALEAQFHTMHDLNLDNLPGFIAMCPGGYPVKDAENWQSGFLPGAYQGTFIDSQHEQLERLIENIRSPHATTTTAATTTTTTASGGIVRSRMDMNTAFYLEVVVSDGCTRRSSNTANHPPKNTSNARQKPVHQLGTQDSESTNDESSRTGRGRPLRQRLATDLS